MDREDSTINCLLEQAAGIVRGSKITAGALEPTEDYKRGQIEELKAFADSRNLWVNITACGCNVNVDDNENENEN